MEFVLPSLLLAVGLVAVIKGGDWFVDGATGIARAFRIPAFVIGATIVSLATTLPEIIVSTVAAAGGSNDMAIGNAVGSVTANTGLIMCLAFIFLGATVDRRQYWLQCTLLIAAAALLVVGSIGGQLSLWATVLLLVIFLSFMTLNLLRGKRESSLARQEENAAPVEKKELIKCILLFLLGAAVVVVGSRLLVDNGTTLATLLGVPERVIAVTLVAIGTSLPELVTTLTAIRKKESNLSIGNIVGANIIDLTLILPLCSLISGKPIPISPDCFRLDLPVCLGVLVLALVPLMIRQKAGKIQGFLPLAAYIAYLIVTVVL